MYLDITAFAFAPSILSANNQFFLCTANGLTHLSAKLFVKSILPSFKNSLNSFLIKEYVKNVYKCEKCGTEESENDTCTFVEAKVPNKRNVG